MQPWEIIDEQINPCPWCRKTDKLKYSVRITSTYKTRRHARVACTRCHVEGPYVSSTNYKADYNGRIAAQNDKELKTEAIVQWNTYATAPIPLHPCELCRFNPPSSGDGKPCTMCPAERVAP